MWNMQGHTHLPLCSYIIESLQSQPEALGSWFTIPFAAKEASKSGDHAHRFSKRRWMVWRFRILSDISCQCFPFCFFKENRARHIGGFTAKLCQMKDPPSHNHI